MRFLVTDIKRGLSEPTFWASFIIGLACILGSLGYYIFTAETYSNIAAFEISQSLVLPFIAPLLATLPFSNMNMLEKDSGYYKLMLLKNEKKGYLFKRWLSVGMISSIAVGLPVAILALIGGLSGGYEAVQEIFQIVLLDFIFGFTYGVLGYALTFYNTKRYIPLVAPQVIYLLLIYAMPYLGLEAYYPPLSFAPHLLPQYAIRENIIGGLCGLIVISFLLTLIGLGSKKVISQYLGGETI